MIEKYLLNPTGTVEDTNYTYEDNVNFLGLRILCYFGLFLTKDYSFGFTNLPEYI